MLPDTTAATISVHLETSIDPDVLLVTDGAPFFPPSARALGLSHEPLDHKAGERRINTVNSRHERLKSFLRGRRGVATKYLGSYLAWCHLAWCHLAILPKLPTPRSVLASVAGLIPAGQPACITNAN